MTAVTTFVQLPVATALNGTEVVALVQAGVSVQSTLARIAGLLPSLIYVTSFSGGTTGLTPATPTTGAIILAGVLSPANGGTGATGFGTVTAYTSNQNITAAQCFQKFSNLGATGPVTLALPTPIVGLEYTFIVAAAQMLTLDVSGSVVIAIGEVPGTPGAGAFCNSPYSSITLTALSTTLWVATADNGSWNNP